MIEKSKDEILEEVRKLREETSRSEKQVDPKKFYKNIKDLAKKLGIKKSKIKPIKIDLSKLRNRKPQEKDAA